LYIIAEKDEEGMEITEQASQLTASVDCGSLILEQPKYKI
jgi:hypothetical protein